MGSEPRRNVTTGNVSDQMAQEDLTGGRTASIAVIDAISAISGTDPTELPPLYERVDPDALNALFDSRNGHGDSDLQVEFSYNGFEVTVQDGPRVTIDPEG